MCTVAECRTFFKDFDDRFLGAGGQTGTDISTLIPFLRDRVNARLNGTPIPAASPDQTAAARRLAREQREEYDDKFTDTSGVTDFDCIQACFARFANGELRDPSDPKERGPNGAYYFLFAEFAALAVQLGIDASFWRELYRTSVKTQEIFIAVYPPSTGAPGGGIFGRSRRFKGPPVDSTRKDDLHREYESKTDSELDGKFKDNLDAANAQAMVASVPRLSDGNEALVFIAPRVRTMLNGISSYAVESGVSPSTAAQLRVFGEHVASALELLRVGVAHETMGFLGRTDAPG